MSYTKKVRMPYKNWYDDPENDPYDDLCDNIKDLNISHMCYGITDSKEEKKFYLKQIKNILEDLGGSIDGILQREERNENEE